MYQKSKVVAQVPSTVDKGRVLYFFQNRGEPKQVVMETGIYEQCLIQELYVARVIYSDEKFIHPVGIIAQACAKCKAKPGNEEGGCKAYYQEKK